MSDPLTTGRRVAAERAKLREPKRRRRGPRTGLTPRQQTLAEKYVPLAKSLAKPLKKSWPLEAQEFESAALLALVEAAQSYDPERSVKFATFASYRIWGALRDVQRRLITAGWRGDIENSPTLTPLTYDAEEHGRVLGSEPDAPIGEALESAEFVESFFKKLPSKHAEACRQIYIHGKTQGEAADVVGCSKSRLSYIHKEALELLNDIWAYRSAIEAKSLTKTRRGLPYPEDDFTLEASIVSRTSDYFPEFPGQIHINEG